jgi:hypothetical protein
MERKQDGLLDGIDNEDAAPVIAAAFVAAVLICLAALLLRLV